MTASSQNSNTGAHRLEEIRSYRESGLGIFIGSPPSFMRVGPFQQAASELSSECSGQRSKRQIHIRPHTIYIGSHHF
jgi:hypothetical protein